ncbi:hypothetical protein JCM11251_004526 [Rhodosporidiobolus azoricus]
MSDDNPSCAPVDRERLWTDLSYRVVWDRDYVEFTKEDGDILHAAAPLILPVAVEIVDGTYEHLFRWTNTKEVFLKREDGFEGDLVTKMEELTLKHPQMLLRKKFLTLWLAKIVTGDFSDPAFWRYLDATGEMHTGRPAFKHRLNKDPLHVDLQYLTLSLTWIQDVVITIVMNMPRNELSSSRKCKILRAFNKIIGIQTDFFQRHYVRTDEEAALDLAKWREKTAEREVTVDLSKSSVAGAKGCPVMGRVGQTVGEDAEEVEEAKRATEDLPEVKV